MPDLHASFESVLGGTVELERETRNADNPLAVLFSTVLKEQRSQLELLLPKLRDGGPTYIADCKQELSVVYHDDELLDPYFRAWLRHLKWSADPFEPQAEALLPVLEAMRSDLKEAAAALESRFGYDTVKYVIPSFYLPTHRQGGAT